MSQQINLFNPVFLQQKKIFSTRTMAQALAVLVLGVAVLAVYVDRRVAALQKEADSGAARLEARKARLATVTAEFAPRQKDPALDAEVQQVRRQLATLREISGILQRGELGDTRGYAEYFRALARQHVDGLWLTGVTVAGAGSEIALRGRTLDAKGVPGYLNRLTREPVMQGKAFGSLQIGEAPAAAGGAVGAVGATGEAKAAPAPWVEFSLQSTIEAAKP